MWLQCQAINEFCAIWDSFCKSICNFIKYIYVCVSTYFIYACIILSIVNVNFSKVIYSPSMPPMVILSNPPPCPVTIHVSNMNITANELSTLKGL